MRPGGGDEEGWEGGRRSETSNLWEGAERGGAWRRMMSLTVPTMASKPASAAETSGCACSRTCRRVSRERCPFW